MLTIKKENWAQQSIKIIAEIAVNMNIVAWMKFSRNLKSSSSAIGYYSYTNPYLQAKTSPPKQQRIFQTHCF